MAAIRFDFSLAHALNAFAKSSHALSTSIERLSSGLKINEAADNPSRLIEAKSLGSTAMALSAARFNAEDAKRMTDQAALGLDEIREVLLRMQALAVRVSEDPALSNNVLDDLHTEFDSLRSQISTVAEGVEYNTKNLLTGLYSGNGVSVFVGAGDAANPANYIVLSVLGVQASLIVNGDSGLLTANLSQGSAVAASAGQMVSQALDYLSTVQNVVAVQGSRLDRIANLLQQQEINFLSAQSKVQDADLASEVATFTRAQIITESATALAAQANLIPQKIISLIDKMT